VRRASVTYVVATSAGEAAMAPVIAEARKRLRRARHVVVAVGEGDGLAAHGQPEPDYRLALSAGSPVTATTTTMERIERIVEIERPSLVVVSGASTTALSAALTALKLGIPCAQIGAGLRTFDRRGAEEVNRVIIDSFAELLCVSSEHGVANLVAEGVDPDRVHLVGSTMVDGLRSLPDRRPERLSFAAQNDLDERSYLLVVLRERTLAGATLPRILDQLVGVSTQLPTAMPVPQWIYDGIGHNVRASRLRLLPPQDYLDLISAESDARAVLTDIGGVEEETTCLDVPCFSLRDRTEQSSTVQQGTNQLLGADPIGIAKIPAALAQPRPVVKAPPLWDGRAAQRVADVLARSLAPRHGAAALEVGVG
jgi:UDP-N-acetylglucosamine 2-epimerase (non-hydrolysing)